VAPVATARLHKRSMPRLRNPEGHARFSNKSIAFPRYCAAVSELRFEDSCDEFPGRRGSDFVMPVASDPMMDSARAGPFESDGGR